MTLQYVGSIANLKASYNNVWPTRTKDLTLRLLVNNKTPADVDVVGDYTEAVGGYSAVTLTCSN